MPAPSNCTSAADCSLNGVCEHGRCVCDPPWDSASQQCGVLSFLPLERPGAAYGYAPNVTSWGGSPVFGGEKPAGDSRWHLFVSEIAGKGCGLARPAHPSPSPDFVPG